MTNEFCFKLDARAQALELSQAKIFKILVPDVTSLNPHLQIYPSKLLPVPLPAPHTGTSS